MAKAIDLNDPFDINSICARLPFLFRSLFLFFSFSFLLGYVTPPQKRKRSWKHPCAERDHTAAIESKVGIVSKNVCMGDTRGAKAESPPVYPSPNITGTGNWVEPYTKAKALVAQLTIEEKSNLTFGASTTYNGCSGFIPGIPRLAFPGLCLSDAGNGVRTTDLVNGYPAGLSVGASWNRQLTTERAHFMAGEFRTKGVNVALGPVVGPLGRIARGGRNWEGFSHDPYLSGLLAADTIKRHHQRGVITSLKHFILNEQETNRNPFANTTPQVEAVSSNVDDKTMHELYLWPFQDAIKAGSANIMCSYQRINNSYGCANSKTLNGLLKTELGFQVFNSGVASALAGLDMTMPDSGYWGKNLTTAIQNGTVPESHEGFPKPGVGMPYSMTEPHTRVDARDPAARPVVFQGAVEGHVLVKNNRALPLKNPQVLSVFGYPAPGYKQSVVGEGTYSAWKLGSQSTNADQMVASKQYNSTVVLESIAINGTIIMGGGSGATTPGYVSSPFDALNQRAIKVNTDLFWDFVDPAPQVPASDACLVFINTWASEGYDRPGVYDDYSDNLVLSIAEQCNNTIVVIHNPGVRLVDNFSDNPNVTAIVYAHTPGQDSGAATVALLYGDENFSGKLPYTVPKTTSGYGPLLDPDLAKGDYINYPQSGFSEGIFIDYRAFEAKNITPRYEFGYGLSYTSYDYASLSVSKTDGAEKAVDLWDVLANVKFTVQNTGEVAGKEAAQLYIDTPSGAKQLRGFEKVSLDPGQTKTVTLSLTRRDLSEWDVVAQSWKLMSGSIGIYVGASFKYLRLQGTLDL
ncbi:putative beta-glucosidase M [Aspergillus cavernicola]|uniref:Probable beta-glucosidase M n=1 Tax=Aspergillus cavernicola TaxID=176166 RepID=A0ABR4IC94_9EURO